MRSSFLEEWVHGIRDSCTGLGITKLLLLLYSTETVIRAIPLWTPKKWFWLAQTPKRFLPKISTKFLCSHWIQVLASLHPCFQLHARQLRYKTWLFNSLQKLLTRTLVRVADFLKDEKRYCINLAPMLGGASDNPFLKGPCHPPQGGCSALLRGPTLTDLAGSSLSSPFFPITSLHFSAPPS